MCEARARDIGMVTGYSEGCFQTKRYDTRRFRSDRDIRMLLVIRKVVSKQKGMTSCASAAMLVPFIMPYNLLYIQREAQLTENTLPAMSFVSVNATQIFDSRGNPTVQVVLETTSGV